MLEFQPGMGLGASKFRVVFVFETLEGFNRFVNSGWEFGANAMADAKPKAEGGALAGARHRVERREDVSAQRRGGYRRCQPDRRQVLQRQPVELNHEPGRHAEDVAGEEH